MSGDEIIEVGRRVSFVSEASGDGDTDWKHDTFIARMLAAWREVEDVDELEEAVKSVLEVFEALLVGLGPLQGIVLSDISNNMAKVLLGARKVQETTVKGMVKKELETAVPIRDSGREALLWLKRALQFVWKTVQKAIQDTSDDDLTKCLKAAYNETLAPLHGLRAHALRLFMNGAPGKKVFFDRLGDNEDIVVLALHKWLDLSEPVLQEIVTICNDTHLENLKVCQVL